MSDNSLSAAWQRRSRSTWLTLAGAVSLCGVILVLLATPTADSYEQSIYAPYPLYFWGLVVLTLVFGQLAILDAALENRLETSEWLGGFLLTMSISGLLVFMPYLRSYSLYGRGDVLTHIGYVKTIQRTGGGPFQNIYQNIHQLVLALSYATGLEPIQVINAVAGIISLFSIVATFALLTAVFDRRRALMTLPFVVTLVWGRAHMNPSPYVQSVMLVPFVLYLFVKTQEGESFPTRLALTIVVVSVTLYHPLTALFLIVVFLLHSIVVSFTDDTEATSRHGGISDFTSRTVLHLAVVVFLAWYYNFVGIILRFDAVLQRLLGPDSGQTQVDAYSSTINEFSPALIDIARIGVLKFGQRGLLLAFGCVFVLMLVWYRLRNGSLSTNYLLTFGLGFVCFSGIGVVFMFVDMIGGFGRPLMFAQFFAVLTVGSLLYYATEQFSHRRVVTSVATIALLTLSLVSVASLYYSPMAGESNQQVTQQELDGAEWYLENDLDREGLLEQGINLYRFEHALNGSESNAVPQDATRPPDHFNYTRHSTLGESFNQTHAYVLTESARQFYPTVYPDYEENWRFTPAEFERLSADPTVSHIYDGETIDIYLVTPPDEQ